MTNIEDILTGENFTEEFGGEASRKISVDDLMAGESMGELSATIELIAAKESMNVDAAIAMGEIDPMAVEMTGEAREVLLKVITTLGGTYGFQGESFMDSVKSVGKSIEIFARKFIAFVGKWIAKAGTLFGAFESTRKEVLKAVEAANDNTTIEITQSWLNTATAFFGANKKGKKAQSLAILTFNEKMMVIKNNDIDIKKSMEFARGKDGLTDLVKSFTGLDGIRSWVETEKTKGDTEKEVGYILTPVGRGSVKVLVTVAEKLPKDIADATTGKKVVATKIFSGEFRFKEPSLKLGEVKVKDLEIDLGKVARALSTDGKARRAFIDLAYVDLKGVLNAEITEEEFATPAIGKQSKINYSKVYFKLMFFINATFKDAIRVGKMIKDGKTPESKEKKDDEK